MDGFFRGFCHNSPMTKLEPIEQAIAALTDDDIGALPDWFAKFHANLGDKKIAVDAKAGRLDKLAAEALSDYMAGRTKPL